MPRINQPDDEHLLCTTTYYIRVHINTIKGFLHHHQSNTAQTVKKKKKRTRSAVYCRSQSSIILSNAKPPFPRTFYILKDFGYLLLPPSACLAGWPYNRSFKSFLPIVHFVPVETVFNEPQTHFDTWLTRDEKLERNKKKKTHTTEKKPECRFF